MEQREEVKETKNFKEEEMKAKELKELEALINKVKEFGAFLEENGELSEDEDYPITEHVGVGYITSRFGKTIAVKFELSDMLLTANPENWDTTFYYCGDTDAEYQYANEDLHEIALEEKDKILQAIEEKKRKIKEA